MAGLIPQAFIDDLLSRVDIVDVIDKRIKLRKTGKNYSALCPFHTEKSPSFSVEPEKQFYYCFGCGAGGNALGFVMDYERLDFPQAVDILAGDYGLTVPREEGSKENKARGEHKALYDILERANQFYQSQLREHPQKARAVNYLKGRGLTGVIAKQFGIGFAPPGWDNLVSKLGESDTHIALLEKTGLVIKRDQDKLANDQASAKRDSHYDRFRDRIVFPIRDSRGRVLGFGGRVLTDEKPKYLNSPETPVYHKANELYGLYEARRSHKKQSRFLIVEGYMDVVALAQNGIDYAVATLGTATNATHLNRLFKIVSEVIYCFDGDQAGRTAAWRGMQATLPVLQDGRQVRFLFLPDGEDPDSLVRKIGQERFNTLIDNATPLADFFFAHLCEGLDPEAIDGKAKLCSLAVPLLKQLPMGIYRQLMIDKLARMASVDSRAIESMMGSVSSTAQQGDEPPPYHEGDIPPMPDLPEAPYSPRPARNNRAPKSEQKKTQARSPSLKAIELLLYKPEVAIALDKDLSLLQENKDEYTDLLLELVELVKQDPTTNTYTMLGHCYDTAQGNQITSLMKKEKITPLDGVTSEFHHLIDALLSDAQKKQFKRQLMEQLKPRVRSGKADH